MIEEKFIRRRHLDFKQRKEDYTLDIEIPMFRFA